MTTTKESKSKSVAADCKLECNDPIATPNKAGANTHRAAVLVFNDAREESHVWIANTAVVEVACGIRTGQTRLEESDDA